jgi:cyclopropane fatty-acyl-phospholipid synthase-like methyltransferase
MSNFKCPLSGEKDELEVVYSFKAKDLAKLYKKNRNIDLSDEFKAEEISLVKNKKLNFYFFSPFVSGSSNFYNGLTVTSKYSIEKNEYLFASKYIKESDKVLDVGCGWGFFSSYIPKSDYLGIEFSEESKQKCEERNIEVTSTLIEDMPKDNKFDVVASFQVLEHIENPMGFVKSMKDVTHDNGLIILSIPNVDSFNSLQENNYLNYPPHHISWWSKDSMLYVARELDLEIIDFEYDRLETTSLYYSISLKRRFNKLFNRGDTLIRDNPFDRFLNLGFSIFAKIFPKPEPALMPNGHSITFVFRKRI